MDDDWGEPNAGFGKDDITNAEKGDKEEDEKNRQDLFFGGDKQDLDDFPTIGDRNGDKNEDKFNQVLSTSKENGGLLASIGLKKGEGNDDSLIDDEEEDPHKKSNLFDNSKDKVAKGDQIKKGQESDEDDFDLGFGSDKKPKDLEAELAGMGSEEGENMTEEQ